jgi:hypothetical protein
MSQMIGMKKIFLLPFVCLVLMVACKKDKDEPEASGVAGYWIGKYSYYHDNYPTDFIAILFRPDSTLRAYSGIYTDTSRNSKGIGTYRLKGDSVIGEYVLPSPFNAYRTIKVVVNQQFTFMEGQAWLTNTTRLGPMYLVKQ